MYESEYINKTQMEVCWLVKQLDCKSNIIGSSPISSYINNKNKNRDSVRIKIKYIIIKSQIKREYYNIF